MNHQTTSDTPETDAMHLEEFESLEIRYELLHDFARKLERERDAAKFDADDESRWAMSYKTQRDAAHRTLREEQRLHVQTLNERDEARASLAAAESWSATVADIGDDFRAKLVELRHAVRNLRDVQGRHHTQQATERLFALLPE